jgi:hypothetical protein
MPAAFYQQVPEGVHDSRNNDQGKGQMTHVGIITEVDGSVLINLRVAISLASREAGSGSGSSALLPTSELGHMSAQ